MEVGSKHFIQEEILTLLPEKAIYWESKEVLIIADLHLGKARHFRANGLAVPKAVETSNWETLAGLIKTIRPTRVLLLGDLFHSFYNREVANLKEFIADFSHISFELIIGNHDVLGVGTYEDLNLIVHHDELIIPPFIFTHEPLEKSSGDLFNLAGHIHPAVIMKGKGRARQKFPCFYFTQQLGLFPAFGAFTGTAEIKPQKNDKIYIIADLEVIAV